MVPMEEALQRIQEWRDGNSSQGKDVGVEDLSLVLAAVLSTVDFGSMREKGVTPLHALAGRSRVPYQSTLEDKGVQMRGIVKLLKDCGLDIDTRRGGEEVYDYYPYDDGQTPLVQAALKGHIALVKGLVEEGADMNKGCGRFNLLPLGAAAGCDYWNNATYGSHPTIISYLLRHGARVEHSDALHGAAIAGCSESVRMLLKAGSEDDYGLEKAGETPAQGCVRATYGSGSERVEVLALLLDAGANVNVRNRQGMSLLHEAARVDRPELIDLLVRRGLSVDMKDDDQRTPLHWAASWGNTTSAKALIRLGASLDVADSKNNTPLHTALKERSEDFAAELITAGANVSAKRDDDIAPLHVAAALGNIKLAYLLLEAGAEVDALTTKEFSPLMVCMSPAKGDNIPALLWQTDPSGWKEGREKVATLLLEMGAAVTKSVMALAGESDCGDVIGAYFSTARDAQDASDGVCNTIAGHISGSAYSEAAKEGRVVRVRLVDRTTGKSKDTQYTLSIPLMELLMDKTGQSGGSSDGPDSHDRAAGSLPTMLDPAGRGFMGIKGNVEVTFDGVDFTEEGFAAVVQFVTTGSVKSLLTRGRRGLLSTEGRGGVSGNSSSSSSSETVGGGGDRRGGGSSSQAPAKSKRERVKLFDDARAKKALQAADFFCIDSMSREVKALMSLYGFELAKEAQED